MEQRHVLMFAHWFPPCSYSVTAAARAHQFATYLPEHGWRTTVITPDLPAEVCACPWCQRTDRTAIDTASQTVVIRVPVTPTLQMRTWAHAAARPSNPATRTIRAGARAVRLFTDTDSDWVERAVAEGLRVHGDDPADAIWTTSSPFSSIRIGQHLQRSTGVPWAADLRDPAITDPTGHRGASAMTRAGRRRWRRPLGEACEVIEVSHGCAALDAPWLGRTPVRIRSAYDPADWANVTPYARSAKFRIVYAGSLQTHIQDPDPFLRGLRAFASGRNAEERDVISFEYLGSQSEEFGRRARRTGTEDLVRIDGWVAPQVARERLAAADVLLLLTSTRGDQGIPGGKLYEYIAARRPILATPDLDLEVAADVRSVGGTVAATDDTIAAALTSWFDAWQRGAQPFDGPLTPQPGHGAPSRAEELASVLSACLPVRK